MADLKDFKDILYDGYRWIWEIVICKVKSINLDFYKKVILIIIIAVAVLTTAIAISDTKWLYLVLLLVPFLIYLSIKKTFIFPFGAYVFLIPFESILIVTESSIGTTLNRFLGILVILVLLLKGSFEKKLKKPDIAVLWLVLFTLYGFLSITWAIQPDLAFSRIQTAGGLLLLYIIVASYEIRKKDYDALKWYILYGGAIAALLLTYQFLTGEVTGRVSLQFGEMRAGLNRQAFDLLIPVSIGIAFMLEQKRKKMQTLLALMLFVIIFGIILTGSRGGLTGVGIILITYMLLYKRKTNLIVMICVAALIIIPIIPEYFIERIGEAQQSRGSGRIDIWIAGLKTLEKYWFAGAGLNNFPVAYTEFSSYAPIYRGDARGAHNIFLNFAVELGVIGFSLMIISMIRHYRAIDHRFVSNNIDRVMLKAAFWGLLSASFFLDTFWYKSFWLLWMLILIHQTTCKMR